MSPKQRIQQAPNAKEAAALLASPLFEQLSETAMLTFVANLPDAHDAQSSMMYHQQLTGAKRFLLTLNNLMTPAPDRTANNTGTLRPVP